MDLGLTGRRAAVAAASRGLGLGVAQALAEEGVRVAICGRSRETIDAAAAGIGRDAVPIVADVSQVDGA
ncbi:MAG TPA: SDR family NAD(P)-dependent oxidoreductase, partial [Acidimicrobiia bacterium]